jgi:peptidoglycan/LPS O-acetylase OafA/YrhL
MRGLAAFVVFLFHAVKILPEASPAAHLLARPLMRPLWDGPGAVMLFFVLSGFVLTLPYVGSTPKKIDTVPFLIRRIARLYPAYWVVISLALALRFGVFSPQGLNGLSAWARMHWQLPITGVSILRHISMISPYLNASEVDPVIWSLIIEMKVSLIFPAILWLVVSTRRYQYAIAALILTLSLSAFIHGPMDEGSPWLHVLTMLPVFLFGSYLAKYRAAIVPRLRTSVWLRVAAGISGLLLYNSQWLLPWLNRGVFRLGSAVGSGILILVFLGSESLEKIGTSRPILFLGDVSYSFYLIQLPILLAMASVVYPLTSSLTLCIAISLFCSLLLAWVIYVTVEIPGQNYGRRLVKSFSNWMASRQQEQQLNA